MEQAQGWSSHTLTLIHRSSWNWKNTNMRHLNPEKYQNKTLHGPHIGHGPLSSCKQENGRNLEGFLLVIHPHRAGEEFGKQLRRGSGGRYSLMEGQGLCRPKAQRSLLTVPKARSTLEPECSSPELQCPHKHNAPGLSLTKQEIKISWDMPCLSTLHSSHKLAKAKGCILDIYPVKPESPGSSWWAGCKTTASAVTEGPVSEDAPAG